MHIAVCDDNVADRKQLERLLGRESDSRKADTGVFYTDSYGDSAVLSCNPMPYDLFFIDLTAGEPDGLSFALSLREFGVTAPIILCCSKIDYEAAYSSLPDCPYEFMYLKKPIIKAELSASIDKALKLLSHRTPTIELRSDQDTYYVTEDDIVYAVANGQYVQVLLKDGTEVSILARLTEFYYSVEMYSHMVLLTDRAMCNVAYLKDYSPFKVTLKNGVTLKSSPFSFKYIKLALQLYQKE